MAGPGGDSEDDAGCGGLSPAASVELDAAEVERYRSEKALAEAIAAGDTALLKGSWLLRFLSWEDKHSLPPLPRRQELPKEAFWAPGDLLEQLNTSRCWEEDSVPVVAVSYRWAARDHPGLGGRRLRHLICALELCLMQCRDAAVFIDWCSLWQEPRAEAEQAAFERSLESVDLWYAHHLTWVWLLTSLPPDNEGLSSPGERGWPFFERHCGSLVSHYDMLLDIGKPLKGCTDYAQVKERCIASRSAPLTPSAFRKALGVRQLSREEDRELLAEMYARAFAGAVSGADHLSFVNQKWSCAEVCLVADCLKWCRCLKVLSLCGTNIGPDGALAIAAVLPELPLLRGLYANECGLRRDGARAIIEGLRRSRHLGGLYLCSNGLPPEDAQPLQDVFQQFHPRAVIRLS